MVNLSQAQEKISYKEAISNALKNGIYVNTIFCGNKTEGINIFWKDGADRGKGKYFNIDSDRAVEYIATPYDDEIAKCDEKINKTYINYGSKGYEKKMNQNMQDQNAKKVSASNYTERAVSKSKAVYKNESWDLVDKVKDDAGAIAKIHKEELPAERQSSIDTVVDSLFISQLFPCENCRAESFWVD